MDADDLRRYLEFYQDLGVKDLYRRSAVPAQVEEAVAEAPGEREEVAMALPPMMPEGESLFQILEDIGDCRRCGLHAGRTNLVFGVGNEKSPLVFVGEGPGADEDAQGIPFVGRA